MPGSESLSPSDPAAFGEYSVIGRLGKGGQGVVYLGRDSEGDTFAIKVLNDDWAQDGELRRRFEREVRAAQKVASFCTAAIHRADLDNDPPYVVSEYVDGPSLQEAVAKDGPRRGAALERLAVSTATALVAIHQAGIVHRDFKPGNVLLGSDGPRVIDFGIARVVDGSATLTNSIMGTPSYMAPEQIEGATITDKADIFAWGCVMAFASTGSTPFGADSVPAVVNRVISSPPDIEGVPASLRPIIEMCLDKNAERRPSARELLMRLLGHDEKVDSASADEAVAQGERLAGTGTTDGRQGPPPPYQAPASGPQTPYPAPPAQWAETGGQPVSGPQTPPGYAPPPMTGPSTGYGASGPSPSMGGPAPMSGPNTSYVNHGMPAQPPPRPMPQQRPGPAEDPVLSQGWIVPAVLIAIIILVLLLILVSMAG